MENTKTMLMTSLTDCNLIFWSLLHSLHYLVPFFNTSALTVHDSFDLWFTFFKFQLLFDYKCFCFCFFMVCNHFDFILYFVLSGCFVYLSFLSMSCSLCSVSVDCYRVALWYIYICIGTASIILHISGWSYHWRVCYK